MKPKQVKKEAMFNAVLEREQEIRELERITGTMGTTSMDEGLKKEEHVRRQDN